MTQEDLFPQVRNLSSFADLTCCHIREERLISIAMRICLNPDQPHILPESNSERWLCPEPGCGFFVERARIRTWSITSLLKHTPYMDLYAASSLEEQGFWHPYLLVRVLHGINPQLLARARTIQELRHPHIHPINSFAYDEQAGSLGLLSRFEVHGSLATYLASNVTIPFTVIVSIIRQLAEALQLAHQHHIVHGHLKPENCLLTAPGVLQVCDFYSAFLEAVPGHPPTPFTAPEQLNGIPVPASDQFALAAFAYLLLEQRTLLAQGKPASWQYMTRETSLPSPPKVLLSPSHPLDQILGRALNPEPDERFPDIQTFASRFCATFESMIESLPPHSGQGA